MTSYTWLRAAASLTGVALIGAETYLSISYIAEPWSDWRELAAQPTAVAVSIAGLAQAIAALVTVASWRQGRRVLSTLTALGLLAAIAFTFTTTYERTAAAREAKRIAVEVKNAGGRVAASLVASAQERAQAACAKRSAECRQREAEVTQARASLAAQPSALETRRLGQLDMVPELALPLMMLLLGLALISFVDPPVAARNQAEARDSAQTSFPVEPPPANLFKPDPTPEAPEMVDERQAAVASFYRAHLSKHGRPPRHRDVMAATGLPRATTSRYLRRVAG